MAMIMTTTAGNQHKQEEQVADADYDKDSNSAKCDGVNNNSNNNNCAFVNSRSESCMTTDYGVIVLTKNDYKVRKKQKQRSLSSASENTDALLCTTDYQQITATVNYWVEKNTSIQELCGRICSVARSSTDCSKRISNARRRRRRNVVVQNDCIDTDKALFIDDDTSFDSCDSFVHNDHDHDISFLTTDDDDDDDGDEEDDDDNDEEEPKEGKENNNEKEEKKKKPSSSIRMMKKGGIMNIMKLTSSSSSSSKQQSCPPAPINVTVKENDNDNYNFNGNDGGTNVNIETLLKGYNDNDDINSSKMNSTIRRKKNDRKLSWKKRLISTSISISTSLSSKQMKKKRQQHQQPQPSSSSSSLLPLQHQHQHQHQPIITTIIRSSQSMVVLF